MLCGCKEPCFENGKSWGHLEGVMCDFLSENVCGKTGLEVNVYTSAEQYEEAKNAENGQV